jgi:signal transduction histidine kinase
MEELIESVIGLYSHKLHAKNITVERNFDPCPAILGMPGELKQAVSNLISNAADAVGIDGVINLHLQCSEEVSGRIVTITVEDDGPGVPSEHSERIFEPFFTTKQDVGTGLGLWVTKGIVDRHGGTIAVRTQTEDGPGGASFTIHLPVLPPEQIAVEVPVQS